MTKPGEPRIQINPALDDRDFNLREWFQIEEDAGGTVRIVHVKTDKDFPKGLVEGRLTIHRRDACALGDWIATNLWTEDDAEMQANQAEADARAGAAEGQAAQEAEQRYEAETAPPGTEER